MLLDLLLSLVADGMVEGAQSRRVPKPLRVIFALLITLFLFTVGGFMLLCAIAMDAGLDLRLVCGALAAVCLGYLVFFIRKVWRAMR